MPESLPGSSVSHAPKIVALLLGVLALGLGLRVPFGHGRSVALGVIVGLVAGAVGLVLALGARTKALQAQQPVGLCTAAVAITVAGTLFCTFWVVLAFGAAAMVSGPG